MHQQDKPEFYTVAEVAARLRVSKMSIYRMCNAGTLPGTMRVGPRSFRINAVQFDLWLAESTEPTDVQLDDAALDEPAETMETA